MFAKKIKFAIAATTLSLSFTQPSFAENVADAFYLYEASNGLPVIDVAANVLTVEGQSKNVDTLWSGRNGNSAISTTQSGDRVEWSYFYVDGNQTTWGSPNNPDLYIKVWIDHSGRIDVNCFHVSVPDIKCAASSYDANGNSIPNSAAVATATVNNRFVQLRRNPGATNFYVVK